MLLDLLFPNRCLGCNTIISAGELVCEICLQDIKFSHSDFSSSNEISKRCKALFPFEHAFSLMEFEKEGLSRKIIHSLKYNGREKTGKILAEWTANRLQFDKENTPDLLATVPLHPKKLKERGYNQLHLFAETLGQSFGIPVEHELIKRNFYSKAQALKDKEHRSHTENMFSLNKKISGKHVLLIDDVYTTGNTAATIAWEIFGKGENRVSLLVMANEL